MQQKELCKKTRSRKDTPRRVTEQAAGARIKEGEEDSRTPYETQLKVHERKQECVRRRGFWGDISSAMASASR